MLAAVLAPRFTVTTSLAGRTITPRMPAGAVRVGGFGGVDGLTAYLTLERIAAVIDATHPFAATISAHAVVACTATGVPRLVVQRPPWQAGPGDRWLAVPSAAAAQTVMALSLPGDAGVLLTVGRGGLPAFAGCAGRRLVVRSVDDPGSLPFAATVVRGRGPFALADELALMTAERIGLVVTRNSGGDEAKLIAARQLGVPVVMIDRPPAPPGDTVADPAAALAWLERSFAVTAGGFY